MRAAFDATNNIDADGNPSGGSAKGLGFSIHWQDGPLGRGAERTEPNGAFVETIIAAAAQRIDFYQQSKFACKENQEALDHLNAALAALDSRTKRREKQQTEGTHKGK